MRNLVRGPVLAGMAVLVCCAGVTGAAHPEAAGASTTEPSTTGWPPPWVEEEPAQTWTEAETDVVRLVNGKRAGCGDLTVHETLTEAAREHSRSMARDGGGAGPWSFGRESAIERAREHGYDRPSGQIVASGFETAEEAVRAWTRHDGYTRVLTDCDAEDIGVGVVREESGGPYWTVVLGHGA